MAKRARPEFEFHYLRRNLSGGERRQAIRKGFEDYQFARWTREPPYPMNDARRWLWQDGAEMADAIRRHGRGAIEQVDGWHD